MQTNWAIYEQKLSKGFNGWNKEITSAQEIEKAVCDLTDTLSSAYGDSCPFKILRVLIKPYWYSSDLEKKRSWREFCESLQGTAATAKISRISSKDRTEIDT